MSGVRHRVTVRHGYTSESSALLSSSNLTMMSCVIIWQPCKLINAAQIGCVRNTRKKRRNRFGDSFQWKSKCVYIDSMCFSYRKSSVTSAQRKRMKGRCFHPVAWLKGRICSNK